MTKRIPKSDVSSNKKTNFTLRWEQTNWHTGRCVQCERDYHDAALAAEAKEIASQQKSKFNIALITLKECPVSPEEAERKFRDSGARWDPRLATWMYSASY